MIRANSSLPTLKTFAELLAWRLSPMGYQWLVDRVEKNAATARLLGMALGIPYRDGKPDLNWHLEDDGLAVLVFVERKRENLPPEIALKLRSSGPGDRYLQVPTDQGPAYIALDLMDVEEMTLDLTGQPKPSPRGEGWRIEGNRSDYGTVTAYFAETPASAAVAVSPGAGRARAAKRIDAATLRVLTAAHVVAGADAPVAVGGHWDSGQVLGSRFLVTTAERWPYLNFGAAAALAKTIDWKVDAAVLTIPERVQAALFSGPKPPAFTEPPPPEPQALEQHLGRRIQMSGQTTGLQTGCIYGIAFEWVIPGLPRQFGDLLIGADKAGEVPASEPGDSGKAVVDLASGATIGLVWDGFYRRLSGFRAESWAFATASDFAMSLFDPPG